MTRRFVPVFARLRSCLALVALLGLISGVPIFPAAAATAVPGESGMVVSPEALATRAGLEILKSGGNSMDAGIAVAFCLSVTYPLAAPIGGGGFLLHRTADTEHHALDFRETAPSRLTADRFLDEEGRPIPGLSLDGGLAIGVPGSVAGLAEAHRRWGSLPWNRLLEPAVRLAEEGFEVYPFLEAALRAGATTLEADPATRKLFAPDGTTLTTGDRLVQRDLAGTLRRIAEEGPAGFYKGPVSRAVAETVRERGGVMRRRDLAKYRPVLRDPLRGKYRDHTVVSFPPPSSGGVALLQILSMLEPFDVAGEGRGAPSTIHRMAEAERRAFADRSRWLGDPEGTDVPVLGLLDPTYLKERAATIRADRATPSREVSPGEPPNIAETETLHVSVVDKSGGAVSMTLTLNRWFGSGIMARGTGVLLNNEMDDFALAPGVPNLYGLVGGKANAVVGGRRPLSSMTPTIVEFPGGGRRPMLVLGTPGGSTIITTVAQVLINVLDHGMELQEAVDAPRFHHQWLPDEIRYEDGTFSEETMQELRRMGHDLAPSSRSIGNVNAIALGANSLWYGAADSRRRGLALGY